MKSVLMTGNQAVARGFYEAGGHVATSYPGSPTVELLETIRAHYPDIYSEFSVNEKVALEVGIGSSFTGARTLVAMKHVGVNVAMDPLMTFTQTRTKGGFVLMTGDDPGMNSSQNEQDNRLIGKFAHMPVLDPSDSEEAKQYTKMGLHISELYETPVMLRITSRLCHGKSAVSIEERKPAEIKGYLRDISNTGMIPPNTYDKQYHMKDRIARLEEGIDALGINRYEPVEGSRVLIVTSGLVYQNLCELQLPYSVYKLGMVYPLPLETLRDLSNHYERIVVVEEMMPFIEDQMKVAGIACEGKVFFSFTGELDVHDVKNGLVKAGVLVSEKESIKEEALEVMGRLPMFCSGCPHRPIFDVLKKSGKTVVGDIGCYSMGILYPLEMLDSVISMGASLGIIKGMQKANAMLDKKTPLIAVIGDGTFIHSGMTGLVNLLHQYDEGANMTIVILNNGTTAMTGGQDNLSSEHLVDLEKLINSMGINRLRVVDQFDYKEMKRIVDAEIKFDGLSVVMTTRPCALKFKVVSAPYRVDPSICIACKSCVKTNCPPIHMKKYEGLDKEKSFIDDTMCVGCSVCSQVCPVGAISRIE